jgi:cell division cycle 14
MSTAWAWAIWLNKSQYAAEALTSRGFAHHSLGFPDCTCPPDAVVAAFFRIVDAAPGALALHCHAGLGRTSTLIALYLMRSCGFSAREAMG